MQVREEKTHTQPLLHYSYDMQNERPLYSTVAVEAITLTCDSQTRFGLVFFSSQYCSYHGNSLELFYILTPISQKYFYMKYSFFMYNISSRLCFNKIYMNFSIKISNVH